jgi:hypothetical protein
MSSTTIRRRWNRRQIQTNHLVGQNRANFSAVFKMVYQDMKEELCSYWLDAYSRHNPILWVVTTCHFTQLYTHSVTMCQQ